MCELCQDYNSQQEASIITPEGLTFNFFPHTILKNMLKLRFQQWIL